MTTTNTVDWTIRTTLEWAQEHFSQRGEENPRLTAQILVGHATGLSRLELYLDYQRPLTSSERTCLREAIRRRDSAEPLQYILGKAPFRHVQIQVRPGVLIPRPETELLVDLVLSALPDAAHVLEVGTGSGCVALSLLLERKDCTVVATDISSTALQVAVENWRALLKGKAMRDSETQGSQAEFSRLQLFCDDVASGLVADPANQARFAVVVSNPPYIPTRELDNLPREVSGFEPHEALDGGDDGLAVFRRLLEQSRMLLAPGGFFACELHEDCLQPASELTVSAGYSDVQIHMDLTGRPRFLTAVWRPTNSSEK